MNWMRTVSLWQFIEFHTVAQVNRSFAFRPLSNKYLFFIEHIKFFNVTGIPPNEIKKMIGFCLAFDALYSLSYRYTENRIKSNKLLFFSDNKREWCDLMCKIQ